jgi:predicted phage tail protein
MKVTILRGEEKIETDIVCKNIQSCLSLLKMQYGSELTDSIINEKYKFVIFKSSEPESAVALIPDMVVADFGEYDNLMILQDVGGEIPVVAVAFITGLSSTGFAAMALTAVVNIALSFALNGIMSLLSPTKQFSSDPSAEQKSSNLFNGGVLTMEQGGIVPYLVGNCFTGGIVISAGVSTEED